MKRNLVVTADDGRVSVDGTFQIAATHLAAEEVAKIKMRMADALANALLDLPYTHFSVLNIKVK